MSKVIKKFLEWLINSSKDPSKLALTLRGGISFLVLLGVNAAFLQGLDSNIVNIVVSLGYIASAGFSIVGFVRKIVITFQQG